METLTHRGAKHPSPPARPYLTGNELDAQLRAGAIRHETALAAAYAQAEAEAADARRATAERSSTDAAAEKRMIEQVADVKAAAERNAARLPVLRQLIASGTPESLRDDLRAAIKAKDTAHVAHEAADAEIARARAAMAEARASLERFGDLDAQRDAHAVAALRAGTLGADDPELTAALAMRDAAKARLADAERAERVLSVAAGDAQAAARLAAEAVETAAAALVVAETDALAGALEEVEARAATLRTLLVSVESLWFSAPGMWAPIQAPLTDRQRRLLTNPPANVVVVKNPGVTAAFRDYFGRLLADSEAGLSGTLGGNA
jgi:hypothetical protein